MAETHEFTGSLSDAVGVFPDLNWQASADGRSWVFNSKEGEYVPVVKGQYIVKIADRYEVHDEKPKAPKAPKVTKVVEPVEDSTKDDEEE